MSSPRPSTYDAMQIITKAVESGSLQSGTDVRWSGAHITVSIETLNYYHPEFRDIRLMAELFAVSFPDGQTRRLYCVGKPNKRYKVPAKDRIEYRARLANGTIILNYVAEHECREYRGVASNSEQPIWECSGCRRQLTITECRKLGFLPPLVKGRRP
ncbi:hypothetical protein [Arthrobacter sp. EpRS71]|uniref:hypothetical protein n=1 Tax=Arthrobacter sp. EpRS71 TaxID=1743141 RepID=UPI000746A2D8|nr:hypothetical protein [Arthrobacter sp. EpRS71]KUM34556.1 hypothetical protein AR689_10465 [Arthrobacter sp. EpRS71]